MQRLATCAAAPTLTPCHPCITQASVERLATYAAASYDYVEDHIRPVV